MTFDDDNMKNKIKGAYFNSHFQQLLTAGEENKSTGRRSK
jgi:hypothetical protein